MQTSKNIKFVCRTQENETFRKEIVGIGHDMRAHQKHPRRPTRNATSCWCCLPSWYEWTMILNASLKWAIHVPVGEFPHSTLLRSVSIKMHPWFFPSAFAGCNKDLLDKCKSATFSASPSELRNKGLWYMTKDDKAFCHNASASAAVNPSEGSSAPPHSNHCAIWCWKGLLYQFSGSIQRIQLHVAPCFSNILKRSDSSIRSLWRLCEAL